MKFSNAVLLVALSVAVAAGVYARDGTESGAIAGKVVDHELKPVSGAVIVVCCAETGIPLERVSGEPFSKHLSERPSLLEAVSGPTGNFSFPEVPAGHYRLVAQAWTNAPADASGISGGVMMRVMGSEAHCFGRSAPVSVPSFEAEMVRLRPLGTSSVAINQGFGNNDAYVLVSTGCLAADPAVGFAAWDDEYLRNVLAYNRMPSGMTIFKGLPATSVCVSVFANDDAPGFGSRIVQLEPRSTTLVTVPIVAPWSNGVHRPPSHIEPIVKHLEEYPNALAELLAEDFGISLESRKNRFLVFRELQPHFETRVELSGGRRAALKDVLAASVYQQLARAEAISAR